MNHRAILGPSSPLVGPVWLALALLAGTLGCGGPDGAWSSAPDGRAPNTRLVRLPQASLPFAGGARAPRAGLASGALAVAHPDADAMRLFARNCATCHGLDGSGQGPSVLDRPARNFKDGGFSFGNTADAIFNTISHGIPGTPMPAFGEALEEADRRRLAAYVRTLGPPVEDVDVADTMLHVTNESGPLVVRGILPPIVEGAPIRPRGLLVGLPGGLTFEYRTDDVRLLGVRHGGFVERTDWRDRGGTPLKPLGGVIWTDSGGDPTTSWSMDAGPDLQLRLWATSGATLRSRLLTMDGQWVAGVEESVVDLTRGELSGFSQRLLVEAYSASYASRTLRLAVATPVDAQLIASMDRGKNSREGVSSWRVYRRRDGVVECVGIRVAGNRPASIDHADPSLTVTIQTPENSPTLGPRSCSVEVTRLFTSVWSDDMLELLPEEGG